MLSAVLLVTCSLSGATLGGWTLQPAKPTEASKLADEYVTAFVETFPLAALFNGMPDVANDRLGDNSLAATRAWEAKEDQWRARLSRIDAHSLHGADVATFGMLKELLDASNQQRVCHAELWPLNQQSGLQIALPLLSQLQPVGTAPLREAALARWRAMPPFIDTEIATLREGLKQGYSLPKANVQAVVAQLDDLLKFAPADSPFAAIAARDSAPGFKDAVTAIVAGQITPALTRYRTFLATDYLARARDTIAVAALPSGRECYRARVRGYATVDMDGKAVQDLGFEQMKQIEAQMQAIAPRAFGTSDVPALMDRLRADPEYKFTTREEMIQVAERAVARAKAAMPKFLTRFPKADFQVDPCQPFEEKSGCPEFVRSWNTGRQASRPLPHQRRRSDVAAAAGSGRVRRFTRAFPGIICRLRWRRSVPTPIRSRGTSDSAGSPKAGRCTRNVWPTRWGCIPRKPTASGISASRRSAPPGSWSIPACTCSTGADNRRSTTWPRT